MLPLQSDRGRDQLGSEGGSGAGETVSGSPQPPHQLALSTVTCTPAEILEEDEEGGGLSCLAQQPGPLRMASLRLTTLTSLNLVGG